MPGTDAKNKLTDEQRTALKDAGVPDDKHDAVAALFAKNGSGGTEADRSDNDADKAKADETPDADKPKGIKGLLAILTGRKEEEFSDEKIAALTEDPAKPKEAEEVALSAEAQKAIDLAASDSAQARRDADAARKELGEERFKNVKADAEKDGVPPVLIDLCADVIKRGRDNGVIELSGGEKFDAYDFATKVLAEAKGVIDLSGEYGKAVSEDDQQLADADKQAKALGEAG